MPNATEAIWAKGEYITCADTARLIRVQLAHHFPGARFSVRSKTYSGGASINVTWQDGPTRQHVQDVVEVYKGGDFDSCIDLHYHVETWLRPDGSAAYGFSAGTVDSRGADNGYAYAPPAPDARMVHMGADFVFVDRDYSEAFARRIRDELAAHWSRVPGDFPELRSQGGDSWCLDWDHPATFGYTAGPGQCDPVRLFREACEQVDAP